MSCNPLLDDIYLWRRAAHQVPTNSLHLKHDIVSSCDARLSLFWLAMMCMRITSQRNFGATDGGPADEMMIQQRNMHATGICKYQRQRPVDLHMLPGVTRTNAICMSMY
eukprot:scaffold45641_cov33-Prasinocladus_malaysianus.AAC.1